MSICENVLSVLSNVPLCQFAQITPDRITYSSAVRDACKANYCGNYGKCWTCPPGVGDLETLRDHFKAYKNAIVWTTCHKLEDPFDVEGMEDARRKHDTLDSVVIRSLEKENTPFELCGAGSCTVCEKCTYPDAPCRFPQNARKSMEATGIDVVMLAQDTGLRYMNGENTVTYFSVLFW